MTEKEIKKIVKVTVEEVQKHKLKPAKNPFQLTELYLSQYKNMEESIQIKLDTIKELREDIPGPKSPTLVQDVVKGGKVENKSQLERREEVINHLVKEVEELSALKLQIEKVMDKYRADKDFRIIQERFFNRKTFDEIGDMFGIDESTVRRRKNRIVKEMSEILFPLCAEMPPKVRLDYAE